MKLLPPMAYYKALLAGSYDNDAALDFVRQETLKTAEKKKKEAMAKMARLPFAYSIYRLCVKKFMTKNFPAVGWKTEWVRCDGKEIHFNLILQESPSSKRSERWRGMEEETSGMIRLQYEEMAG